MESYEVFSGSTDLWETRYVLARGEPQAVLSPGVQTGREARVVLVRAFLGQKADYLLSTADVCR